jgi:Circularly permutated YpsA SLOG family
MSPTGRHLAQHAHQHGKPEFVVDATDTKAPAHAAAWLGTQRKRFGPHMTLSIGGPRESEAPGIYARAKALIATMLDLVR